MGRHSGWGCLPDSVQADSAIYLEPIYPSGQPSFNEAWFYADCISFEHEIPTIVFPTPRELKRFSYRYIHSGRSRPKPFEYIGLFGEPSEPGVLPARNPRKVVEETLTGSLVHLLSLTHEIRHGPFTFILFKGYGKRERQDFAYSLEYRRLQKEISLFATALRQSDFLSEYLCYYRVIESISQSNGKSWIAGNLGRIHSHDYGYIGIGHADDEMGDPPRNLLRVLKSRAIARYRALLKQFGEDTSIARYLYNVNRCGIAHGRGEVLSGQVTPSYFEVGRDTIVLKMLCRMAIEDESEET